MTQSLAAARLALASATLAFALTLKGNALSTAVASFQTRVTLLLVRLLHHDPSALTCRSTALSSAGSVMT